jgi:hypothetical protein
MVAKGEIATRARDVRWRARRVERERRPRRDELMIETMLTSSYALFLQ